MTIPTDPDCPDIERINIFGQLDTTHFMYPDHRQGRSSLSLFPSLHEFFVFHGPGSSIGGERRRGGEGGRIVEGGEGGGGGVAVVVGIWGARGLSRASVSVGCMIV